MGVALPAAAPSQRPAPRRSPVIRMRKRILSRAALLLLLSLAVAGCTGIGLPPVPSPTPTPLPTPTVPLAGDFAHAVPGATTPTPAALPEPEGADATEARRIAIYERVAPAVVSITTQMLRTGSFWGLIPAEGSGSGFLWDERGYIVTNNHVIEGAQSIEVAFGSDLVMAAEVVGTDPTNDLAVLKVAAAPEGVQPVEIGASADLRVGQTTMAIGNPFGRFERTMTQGIVSAVNRTVETESTVLRGVIQTDAAVNTGNSGGPLLDSSGRLIGVTTAIYSPSGASAGVSLAIPVDKVLRVVPALIRDGRFPRPWLGIEELGYEITPALAQSLRLPAERGLLVARLYQDSPADRAGLKGASNEAILGHRRYLVGGDILTAIDGRALGAWEDLNAYLEEEAQVGQTVLLSVLRDGRELSVQATLADMPESLLSQGR